MTEGDNNGLTRVNDDTKVLNVGDLENGDITAP